MSNVSPSGLLFSPSSPTMGVESIRRFRSDPQSLIIDAVSIRKRALYHRSRAFLGVYFGTNYPLNTAYALPAPNYRTTEESTMALSAIHAALNQLLLGLNDAGFTDKDIEQAIIRTDCRWAVHVLSSGANQRERAYRDHRDLVEWEDERPEMVLAKLVEDSIYWIRVRHVVVQFWIVDTEDLAEARELAEGSAAQRSKENAQRFKDWMKGFKKNFFHAGGVRAAQADDVVVD